MIKSLEVGHLQQTQPYCQPPLSSMSNIPTTFFYQIVTQQDARHMLEGFEPYPEECGVPLPDLSSSDDNKNLCRLNKYWRRVDGFVREQYAGWKEREEQLARMQRGSEGVWKWGREVSETDVEVELSSKKKRTVSDFVMVFEILLKFGLGPSEHPSGSVRFSTSECHL